jgi:hypothetical protein
VATLVRAWGVDWDLDCEEQLNPERGEERRAHRKLLLRMYEVSALFAHVANSVLNRERKIVLVTVPLTCPIFLMFEVKCDCACGVCRRNPIDSAEGCLISKAARATAGEGHRT